MRNKLLDPLYHLSTIRTADEKIGLMNSLLTELINHFHGKAGKSKQFFEVYKYGSIILAAATTIVSSLQVIYPSSFPQWILPITSAGATVAVALLGASSAQKYGSIPGQRNSICKQNNFYSTSRRVSIAAFHTNKVSSYFQKDWCKYGTKVMANGSKM